MEGDLTAIKLVLERLIPPQKEMPITADLPTVTTAQDLPKFTEAILQGVCCGELLAGQATALCGLVTAHSKALEIADLEERISRLE